MTHRISPPTTGVVEQVDVSSPTGAGSVAVPSLHDGMRFLPNVLGWDVFQRDRIAFRSEPGGSIGYHWAVVDPRRYKLTVWQKPTPGSDFVDAAKALGAALFSNGPFVMYKTQKHLAWLLYGLSGSFRSWVYATPPVPPGGIVVRAPEDFEREQRTRDRIWQEEAAYWFGSIPNGDLVSATNRIAFRRSARHKWYFGRSTGTGFGDYRMAKGDPPQDLTEVISGLYSAVSGGQPVPPVRSDGTPRTFTQWGHYGLAPLDRNDERLLEAGLEEALSGYQEDDEPPLLGLIFVFYYAHSFQGALMANAGIREAVTLDGNSSVLFGRGDKAIVGDDMPSRKRDGWMSWGYAFDPV